MILNINYGTSVLSLPASVLDKLEIAGGAELKVLVALASNPTLLDGTGSPENVEALTKLCGVTEEEISSAVAFWRGAGVLQLKSKKNKKAPSEETSKADITPTAPVQKDEKSEEKVEEKLEKLPTARKNELPHYTTEQLAALLEERAETAEYIHECERVFGKIFNSHEVNIILGLVDYLGLEWEYILSLLAYVKKSQDKKGLKKSLRAVEKMAFDFYDMGVLDMPTLLEKLKSLEMLAEAEGQLRSMFGMGERALTPKEKKCFSTWLYDYNYSIEIIKMAYDITVDAKGAPNINYLNSVLANWNKDNLRTVKQIKKSLDDYAASKASAGKSAKATGTEGSFETDDFFRAAVRRSFGDDFEG